MIVEEWLRFSGAKIDAHDPEAVVQILWSQRVQWGCCQYPN
jgi:hypothetical protein